MLADDTPLLRRFDAAAWLLRIIDASALMAAATLDIAFFVTPAHATPRGRHIVDAMLICCYERVTYWRLSAAALFTLISP